MTATPLILGHRGASAVAPENTLIAFAKAIESGADGIEFDVRLSSDDEPVVIHDASLKRTGSKNLAVRDLTAAELKKVNVGSWFAQKHIGEDFSEEKIPTLNQVFELFSGKDGLLYVEMKCRPKDSAVLAREVVKATQTARMADRVIVLCFNLDAILTVKEIDKGIRTAALFEPKTIRPSTLLRKTKMIDIAKRYQTDELALHHTLATARLTEKARQEGMETIIWTVDGAGWMKRARTLGVKGLMANDPGSLVRLRESL